MVLDTYGRSTGFCIDPLEKKPLYHFHPGNAVLSFGTAGCNLGCRFCQNWGISKSREVDALCQSGAPKTLARSARDLACKAIAFTYNDPVIFAEYAIDTAEECRQLGVATVAVTAGYISTFARAEFFAAMDAANVDLKAFHPEFYRRHCLSGKDGLKEVLDTLIFVRHQTRTWLEITTLLIPGLNDSASELQRLCRWICDELGADVPLHFTAFHPDFRMRDRHPTPASTLRLARQIALDQGLHYVYTGNIHDPHGQSSFCPACRALLVERDGYRILQYRLNAAGRCPDCNRPIAGVFDEKAGDWGSQRQPVWIQPDL